MSLVFAAIAPHPPILLPNVGSEQDREKVKKTIENMNRLGSILDEKKPTKIAISSPHPQWGFDVPLYFLAKNFKGEVEKLLLSIESPKHYFEKGRSFYKEEIGGSDSKFAFIASGDLSHCLKVGAPNGFHPDGPKFDEELIECIKKKDVEKMFRLDEKYPEAAECGLRSICFLFGVLEQKGKYTSKVLSYEEPFGVGYLVVNFEFHE